MMPRVAGSQRGMDGNEIGPGEEVVEARVLDIERLRQASGAT